MVDQLRGLVKRFSKITIGRNGCLMEGVWTQQKEEAHANADLIRELIPYSYEFVRSVPVMSPFVRNTSKTIEKPKYII